MPQRDLSLTGKAIGEAVGEAKRQAMARRHAERQWRRAERRRQWRCFWAWPLGHRYETPDGRGSTEAYRGGFSGGARPDLRCVGCGREFSGR
jgi:hypothetical protein